MRCNIHTYLFRTIEAAVVPHSRVNNNGHSRCWFIGCDQLNCMVVRCLLHFMRVYQCEFALCIHYYHRDHCLSLQSKCDCCPHKPQNVQQIPRDTKQAKCMRMTEEKHTINVIDFSLLTLSMSCLTLNRFAIFINRHLRASGFFLNS